MRPGLAIPFHFVIFEETRGAADESQWPRSFLGTPDRDLGFLFSHRVQTARGPSRGLSPSPGLGPHEQERYAHPTSAGGQAGAASWHE
jgi:hypothetical protein